MHSARLARLFVEDSLSEMVLIQPDQMQIHYLSRVLRMRSGDQMLLFNGRDGEWYASVEGSDREQAVQLRVRQQRRIQVAEPGPWLLFAPIKQQRLMRLVEHACELGVSRLCPVITQRTNSSIRRDRIRRVIIEAAEQSQRLTIPELSEPTSLNELLESWGEGNLLLCAETGPAEPIARVLATATPTAIFVGPEGGFAQGEFDAMARKPFITFASLGARILRCESAALAALACWQSWTELLHSNVTHDNVATPVAARPIPIKPITAS